MINHLVGLGHRRIATIHGPLHSCQGDRRREGYHDALTSRGIEVRPEYELAGHFGIEESKEAVRHLLELDEPPTAIVCNNDYTALGALSQVRSMGMHVPEDVSIASFLNIGMSAHTNPSLTAMTIDRRKLGDTLAWLMVARLANPGKPFTVIDFGMQLQIRESCKEVSELRAAGRYA
jgi:DNA-binding LacI/PurR family transcriptional regulator